MPHGRRPPRHLALRVACAGLRVLFRRAPGRHWKCLLWERVVRPHILSRSFPIAASTRFGARVEGRRPDPAHGAVYFFGTWQPAIAAMFEVNFSKNPSTAGVATVDLVTDPA
jgi:hypothetical protein